MGGDGEAAMSAQVRKSKGPASALAAAVIALAMLLIAPWEVLRLKPYRDIVGVWTACYGHTDAEGGPKIERDKTYTKAECEALLRDDTAKAYADVARCIRQDLPIPTLAAFTSARFNLGPKVVCGSTLQYHANRREIAQACLQLRRWNRAGNRVVQGLVNRREAEYKVCMQGFGK